MGSLARLERNRSLFTLHPARPPKPAVYEDVPAPPRVVAPTPADPPRRSSEHVRSSASGGQPTECELSSLGLLSVLSHASGDDEQKALRSKLSKQAKIIQALAAEVKEKTATIRRLETALASRPVVPVVARNRTDGHHLVHGGSPPLSPKMGSAASERAAACAPSYAHAQSAPAGGTMADLKAGYSRLAFQKREEELQQRIRKLEAQVCFPRSGCTDVRMVHP